MSTVLLDLDGTLVDTAPDMAYTLNALRGRHGLTPLPMPVIRPRVSHGAIAMLELGFPGTVGEALDDLRTEFLALYAENLVRESALFPGMGEALDRIESHGRRWGIVTNKPGWLTTPLLEGLGLHERAACVVSGDTLPQRKPDPAPLLHACKLAGSTPDDCVYVGDAERDIQAGRRSGMRTAVALFGYLDVTDQPESWGADALLVDAAALLNWLALEAVEA